MKNNLIALKKPPLFYGVSEDEIGALVKCAGGAFQNYKKGEAIYLAGARVRDIGVVADGKVHIVKDDVWGNSNIIAEIPVGEMFAEAVVCAGEGVMRVSVIAAADCEVCFLNFLRITAVCSSACDFHAILIRNIISAFARKNIALAEKMEHITKRSTREKLLSYLLERSKISNGKIFEIPFNRQELADYLSVDRSALSAEMSRLKSDGIIDYQKNRFELLRC